ncbi:23S rRNA (adenine(1618)-N(6))-methyltransferase RlmF [Sphingobacterium bovisgrunnientis]|uniref:23S rRNA (adenine(1618)-N(6))-methyltransferase RlmF n=1 Tax=Sphingobacterium bovisgrunnientis TaxID=1874697 RepID=UPI0013596A74|nr:23S rRNA (adenine(1618)-N(6))-methyltransferase RlmF [Sphingobacterium bovisgrunnientis]
MHKRNKHLHGYDLKKLKAAYKGLSSHIIQLNEKDTIDFSNPKSVLELNKALLIADYKLKYWNIMPNSLCPAVPGRADYIHHLADLLATTNNGEIPTGKDVKILDIGTGSSVIYPIIGAQEYNWDFIGTEIDRGSIQQGEVNVNKNIWLKKKIKLRFQDERENILDGIMFPEDKFDAVISNPPFFKSREDNWTKSTKKFQNLKKGTEAPTVQNFAGHPNELWCSGGEKAFITKLIYDSQKYKKQIKWTTSLVSSKDHLKPLISVLEYHKAAQVEVIEMTQGQKKMRILAWRWE